MIKAGDRMPDGVMTEMQDGKPTPVNLTEWLQGKKSVLVSVPGAYTPTCSMRHLPGFVQQADALKGKGVDQVACMAVNDPFVLAAWGKDQSASGKVTMFADGSGDYTRALGMELDLMAAGLGMRGKRFALLIEDGVIKHVGLDEEGFSNSSAEAILKVL